MNPSDPVLTRIVLRPGRRQIGTRFQDSHPTASAVASPAKVPLTQIPHGLESVSRVTDRCCGAKTYVSA